METKDIELDIQLNLIFEINETQLFEIHNQLQQTLITAGYLGVYDLQEYSTVVLKLNDWQYTLQKDIPVLTQQQEGSDQKIYILPKQGGGNFGLLFQKDTDQDLIDCFESIIAGNANLMQSSIKQPQQEEYKQSTSEKIQTGLNFVGNKVKEGLIYGATVAKSGIVQTGEYVQDKVTPSDPIQIKAETMMKIKFATNSSKTMLQYNKVQVEGMVFAAKTIATEVATQAENSNQKYTGNEYYKGAKDVGKGVIYMAANIYDGMFQALCLVGEGVQTASTGVVQKKYGDQAAEVLNSGMTCVGNLGKFSRISKDALLKNVKDEEKKDEDEKEKQKQKQQQNNEIKK